MYEWPAPFQLHDVSSFPVVYAGEDDANPAFAMQWQREMDMLISRGDPFVVIFPPGQSGDDDDTPMTDAMKHARKQRVLWIKENRQRLQELCKGLVTIEKDVVKRALKLAKAIIFEKAFGVPFKVAASESLAISLGNELLRNA